MKSVIGNSSDCCEQRPFPKLMKSTYSQAIFLMESSQRGVVVSGTSGQGEGIGQISQDYFHPESPNEKKEKKVYHYRCRFFNKKKRICDIYEIRPMVCRTYPDNPNKNGFKFCSNPKCRWKKQIKLREAYTKMMVVKKKIDKKSKGEIR